MHFIFFVYILCVCVYTIFFLSLLMHLFSHSPFVHVHLPFCFNNFFVKVIGVLSIASLIMPPFQKVCGNCHIADVIISPMGNVHCNARHSKSTIQKSGFLRDSIATNDEHVLLITGGKWLEAIVHMTESKFLDLLHSK